MMKTKHTTYTRFILESLKIELTVHENGVDFEIDTGSGLTIISETTYRNYFAKYDLIKNNVS